MLFSLSSLNFAFWFLCFGFRISLLYLRLGLFSNGFCLFHYGFFNLLVSNLRRLLKGSSF